ncbi:MAG: response regulator transcription factor [Lachnospiraceae bacterium]|nr:response regulator transcription factor [Lachnospiraceae bacterium]
MDSSIILCGHDLLWDAELKKEFAGENIFITYADSTEDAIINTSIFPFVNTSVIVCPVGEFLDFIEYIPDKTGYNARRNIPPVLAIAVNYSADDELAALKSGCFDYQLKTAPVKAVAQRIRNKLSDMPQNSNIYYDMAAKDIFTDGHLVNLTKREREVLYILVCNKGIPVSKNIILKEVWGNSFNGNIRVIDTIIKQLRQKLSGCNLQIITHYGRGISLEMP